jgi:hypothetical protein
MSAREWVSVRHFCRKELRHAEAEGGGEAGVSRAGGCEATRSEELPTFTRNKTARAGNRETFGGTGTDPPARRLAAPLEAIHTKLSRSCVADSNHRPALPGIAGRDFGNANHTGSVEFSSAVIFLLCAAAAPHGTARAEGVPTAFMKCSPTVPSALTWYGENSANGFQMVRHVRQPSNSRMHSRKTFPAPFGKVRNASASIHYVRDTPNPIPGCLAVNSGHQHVRFDRNVKQQRRRFEHVLFALEAFYMMIRCRFCGRSIYRLTGRVNQCKLTGNRL